MELTNAILVVPHMHSNFSDVKTVILKNLFTKQDLSHYVKRELIN